MYRNSQREKSIVTLLKTEKVRERERKRNERTLIGVKGFVREGEKGIEVVLINALFLSVCPIHRAIFAFLSLSLHGRCRLDTYVDSLSLTLRIDFSF